MEPGAPEKRTHGQCSPWMVNGSAAHLPRRAGKFPYPCRIIGSTHLVVSGEFQYTTWILKTANEKRCLFCQPQPFVRGQTHLALTPLVITGMHVPVCWHDSNTNRI